MTESEPSNNIQTTYTGGVYTQYTGDIPAEGDTVLFFHADRCPTCRQAELSFKNQWVPEWVTILEVDYDTADELKKKYQILTQSSFAYIASDGALIKRWVGGTTVQDFVEQLADAKSGERKPWEVVAEEWSNETREAYFAWWCFWCLEWPFESINGVKEAIAGYAGGSEENANYDAVASGETDHREAVKVVYDPALVSFEELIDTYRRQIDPTDDGGQFADRGFQYTTALYWSTEDEKQLLEESKTALEELGKFTDPIVVKILPVTTFYEAEEYHQDYYKKQSNHYERYKKWSWREGYIQDTWKEENDLSHLTELQRRVTQEWYTEEPFNNAYWDNKDPGIYVDIIDGTPLFSSTDKFDSETGWPSFTKPIGEIDDETDLSHGMVRTEIRGSNADGHLWHVFNDGPDGGKRYCINSAALQFIPLEEMELKGYGEWLYLFEDNE